MAILSAKVNSVRLTVEFNIHPAWLDKLYMMRHFCFNYHGFSGFYPSLPLIGRLKLKQNLTFNDMQHPPSTGFC